MSGTGSPTATAALALADGTVFHGRGLGARGEAVGEICFNTAMSGYQEILTDPSYAGQIITFTFPHIGNVGTNEDDLESGTPAALGLVLRADITEPSNWRSVQHLERWLERRGLIGIAGVDTRRLTRLLRSAGAQDGALVHTSEPDAIDEARLIAKARAWPGLEGMDLAKEVCCRQAYDWTETAWDFERGGYGSLDAPRPPRRRGGLRRQAEHPALSRPGPGCRVTVVPATADAESILAHEPDGIFLSNGPGDPAATGDYAVPVIRSLMASGLPIFGICLGHQLLALALGAETRKMPFGHRGANHPVKDLATGRVEITSQNHGFEVTTDSLPAGVTATHVSLFDGTLEGLAVDNRPIFSVQYHPEASPGPQDAQHLFARFVALMD